MTSMLTVRVDAEQRSRLRAVAAAQGKTEAELIRTMLDRELAGGPLGSRVAGVKGSLSLCPAVRLTPGSARSSHATGDPDDTPMDFADATLVLVAAAREVAEVCTLDRRGVSTYRTPAGKPFELVLDL